MNLDSHCHRIANGLPTSSAGMFMLITTWDTEWNATATGNEYCKNNAHNPLSSGCFSLNVCSLVVLASRASSQNRSSGSHEVVSSRHNYMGSFCYNLVLLVWHSLHWWRTGIHWLTHLSLWISSHDGLCPHLHARSRRITGRWRHHPWRRNCTRWTSHRRLSIASGWSSHRLHSHSWRWHSPWRRHSSWRLLAYLNSYSRSILARLWLHRISVLICHF